MAEKKSSAPKYKTVSYVDFNLKAIELLKANPKGVNGIQDKWCLSHILLKTAYGDEICEDNKITKGGQSFYLVKA